MISEGFRIRAIAAKDERTKSVVGAIFSNFAPKIGEEKGKVPVEQLVLKMADIVELIEAI